MAIQVCDSVFLLTDLQVQLMDLLNKKFYALRRLAALLEQLADLSGFIPDITKLIPLSAIDIPLYESLRNACPFLNLPPADSSTANEGIGKLQGMVAEAYAMILRLLNNNPLARMQELTAKMDEYQTKLNVASLAGSDFLACLMAACNTVEAGIDSFENLSKFSANDALNIAKNYKTNFVDEQGRVMNAAQQGKVDDFEQTRQGVRDLFDADVSGVTGAGNRVLRSV
jgi:hypothetical protein